MKKFLLGLSLAALSPVFVFAQSSNAPVQNTFDNLSNTAESASTFVKVLTGAVNTVIPLLLAVAVVVFIWTMIRFLTAKTSNLKSEARGYMIFSIIAIAVIIAIFGLAQFLIGFFGVDTGPIDSNTLPGVTVN